MDKLTMPVQCDEVCKQNRPENTSTAILACILINVSAFRGTCNGGWQQIQTTITYKTHACLAKVVSNFQSCTVVTKKGKRLSPVGNMNQVKYVKMQVRRKRQKRGAYVSNTAGSYSAMCKQSRNFLQLEMHRMLRLKKQQGIRLLMHYSPSSSTK